MTIGSFQTLTISCAFLSVLILQSTIASSSDEYVLGPSNLREAYFNGTSYIRVLTTLSLQRHTGISFRTCVGGELFSQRHQDTLISLSVQMDKLTLLITTSTHRYETVIKTSESILDNRWHSINLIYANGNLTLYLDKYSQLVANASFNSDVLTNPQFYNNTGAVFIVGNNFNGCLLEGPSLVFNSSFIQPHHVTFGPCLLSSHNCSILRDIQSHLNEPVTDYCIHEPCLRHGKCISLAKTYECKCTARYMGKNCEIDAGDPCAATSNPCQNGGSCKEDITGNITCYCPTGFTGLNCENDMKVHPQCDNNLCLNNSTCRAADRAASKTVQYVCVCLPGYSGDFCETDINECAPKVCENGGVCHDLINNYTCVCDGTGYTGRHCSDDIDECRLQPQVCGNNGICFNTYGSYVCQCFNGYFGLNCEMSATNDCTITPCKNNGLCVANVHSKMNECVCKKEFTGLLCERSVTTTSCTNDVCDNISMNCLHNPCVNGATCIPYGDSYNCTCPPGYTGNTCDVVTNCTPGDCLNGGVCMLQNGSNGLNKCECPRSFTGVWCERRLTCSDNPCKYSRSCRDYTGGYYCTCKSGWTGINCDLDIDECFSGPCLNGGTCINTLNSHSCRCASGFAGRNCQYNIDECVSTPCLNSGTCIDQINGYNCSCSDKWMGVNCERPYDVCEMLHPCQNNATCLVNPHNRKTYECKCADGFEGRHCSDNIDDCLGVTCRENQICVDGINAYECRCPPGYGGDDCSLKIDPCAEPSPCLNDGKCFVLNDGTSACDCVKGFTGKKCEKDVDECDLAKQKNQNVCNGGICVNRPGGYDCYCRPGYTGDHCDKDVDECLSQPCRNGATCLNQINNFQCVCKPGYTGKECGINIDECESNPCMEGSTCIDGIASFTCVCPPGLTGLFCQINIDDCSSSPCQNAGKCIDGLNSYSCNCKNTGFEGLHCEINIDDCINHMCENGAMCVDKVNDYDCQCFAGYTGQYCETDINECEAKPCKNNGTCLQRSDLSLYTSEGRSEYNFTLPDVFYQRFSFNTSSGYECVCIAGTSGTNCEININECESNPCKMGTCNDFIGYYTCECDDGYDGEHCDHEINECEMYKPCVNGTCHDQVANYICECAPGYGGKNCSVELIACQQNNTCLNNGTCIPYLVNETQHLFNCSCTFGFYGPYCEQSTTMSLNGTSYAAINTIRDEGYDIQFRFKTTLANGLLALGKGLTYYILELSNGRLNLHSSILNKWEGVFIGSGLNDSKWQKVFVAINSSHLVLAANEEQTIYPINLNEVNASHTSFPLTYIGGTISYLRHLAHGSSFVGCVQDVVVNNDWVLPTFAAKNNSISLVNVEVDCHRGPQCEPNPCHSGGHCTDLWRTFSCSCERPYIGHTCQYNYTAATFGYENITNSLVTVNVYETSKRAVRLIVDISMFVRTREHKGQIFYLGSALSNSDLKEETYISAQLDGGELLVRIQFNRTPEAYTVGGVRLDDGYNHLIEVSRNFTLVQVKLNGTEYFRKTISATGQLDVNVLYLGGFPQTSRLVRQAEITLPTAQHRADLNLSVPNFKGVIQDVQLSNGTRTMIVEFFPLKASDLDVLTAFGNVTFETDTILEGVVSDDMCRINQCHHNGTCYNTWNDFSCKCPTGYKGKICEEMEFCELRDCPQGSTCNNLNDGYECIANATFDGRASVHTYNYTTLKFDQIRTFNEIVINYRTRTGGTILIILKRYNYFAVSVFNDEVVVQWKLESNGDVYRFKKESSDGEWAKLLVIMKDNVIKGGFSDKMRDDSPNFIGKNFDVNEFNRLVSSAPIILGGGYKLFDNEHIIDTHWLYSSNVGSYFNTETPMLNNGIDNPILSEPTTEMTLIGSKFGDNFKGCLGEIRLGGLLLPFFPPEQLYPKNVTLMEYFTLTNQKPMSFANCTLCFDNECQNGGVCANPQVSYTCKCPIGFTGDDCSINIDECIVNSCQHNSTCRDGIANYTCECETGWEGWLCDRDIDDCASTPCLNGATCQDLLGEYNCVCDDAYVGRECEALKIITCENNPCRNHSICIDGANATTHNNFTCSCASGFIGILCDTPYCLFKACVYGICNVMAPTGPMCECFSGFTGEYCEVNVDDCAINEKLPCENGGTCVDGNNSYTCNCSETGYTGLHCELDIDECENFSTEQLCGINGQCVNLPGKYRCVCPKGLCGFQCRLDDPCWPANVSFSDLTNLLSYDDGDASKPSPRGDDTVCGLFGTCVESCDLETKFECICDDGYEGLNCSQAANLAHTDEDSFSIAYILIPLFVVVLLVGAITLSIFVVMARNKRATRGTYSPSAQEFCNPRVEMDHVLKPPPEERLI